MTDKYFGEITGTGTDNKEYVIYVYQDESIERSSDGMIRHEGLKHYELQFGGDVRKISETVYEITATGVRVTVQSAN
ncbi:hypothetical protein LOY42_03640 [Pseudomonas sp. B21-023]|uniref:hypothetical protein n=1 Tax=unclassified Pseudomonas TaxID=196821 RepID=UPI00111A85A5|nr:MULTISPECIES: hypothetical protein [unclassified Pseudomonas]UVM17422.1 hypothetical protein LOY42_03640 [Pseudomonas sp. B21-023]